MNSFILSDDIKQLSGLPEGQKIEIMRDYIKYMQEQINFWAANRQKDAKATADKVIDVETAQTQMGETVVAMAEAVAAIDDAQSEMSETVGTLSGNVTTLATNVGTLTTAVGTVQDNVSSLTTTVGNLSNKVNSLGNVADLTYTVISTF